MNAREWNAQHLVGTPVAAYPGTRDDVPLITRTRSEAWTLGHDAPVVMVEGYAGGIALTHVDAIARAAIRAKRPVAERQLTQLTFARIAHTLDRAGVFTKDFTEYIGQQTPGRERLTVTGLRIGVKPGHVVAKFGDTIVCHADGTYSVRHAEGGESR